MDLRTHSLMVKLLLVVSYIGLRPAVTTEEDKFVAQVCTDLVRKDMTRLAGFVRVAFHDCVSGCDGCIDLIGLKEKHGGLDIYLEPLDAAYDSCNMTGRGVSKADFYAKCGQVAAELGRFDSPEKSLPEDLNITVRYGRQDCSDTNGGVGYEKRTDFPDEKQGLFYVLLWCLHAFGMDSRACTALMGAHTLGRAHKNATGYTNAWVDGPGEQHLDVGYYRGLQDLKWQQHDEGSEVTEGARQRWQWSVGVNQTRLMLNTDLCLKYDIAVNSNGECAMENTDNCTLSETSAIVEEYSKNNILWLNEFGQAFTKMIDTPHAGQTKPLVAVEGGAAPIPTEMSEGDSCALQ